MIDGLKPYPVMKDSGEAWLGEIPAHWALRSLASLISPVSQRGRPDLPLLSVVREKGIIPRASLTADENHNYIPDDLSNYKVARAGNLVINKMKAWQGSLGIAPMDGIVSPAYYVFNFEIEDRQYGQALLRSKQYVAFFAQASDGIRIGQWDLSIQRMKRIPIVVLPRDEQAAIVRFLDHTDRRIRRYIRAKQKLLKLLEEQKQAIIHRVVTCGLDPNVRLKPSGVGWLGDVPSHWEVAALRRRWSVTDCKHLTVPFVEDHDGIQLASVREVQSFELCLAEAKRTTRAHYESLIQGGRRPRAGDLIYCRNVSVGAAALVTTEEPLAMGQDVCLIRSRSENQRYLNYFLHSPAMRHQLAMLLVGSTFNRVNVSDIKALLVIVPPRAEQDAIASHLDVDLAKTARAQSLAADEISLLRKYRTRLIADVVTGKLDVREAAARLPDEADEPAPFDEIEAEGEEDEAGDDDTDEVGGEAET